MLNKIQNSPEKGPVIWSFPTQSSKNLPAAPTTQDAFVGADNSTNQTSVRIPLSNELNFESIQKEVNNLNPTRRDQRLAQLRQRIDSNQRLTSQEFIEYLVLNNKTSLAESITNYFKNKSIEIPFRLQHAINTHIIKTPTNYQTQILQELFSRIRNGRLGNIDSPLHRDDWVTGLLLYGAPEVACDLALLNENPNNINHIRRVTLPNPGLIAAGGIQLFPGGTELTLPQIYHIFLSAGRGQEEIDLFLKKYLNGQELTEQETNRIQDAINRYQELQTEWAQREITEQQQALERSQRLNQIRTVLNNRQWHTLTNEQFLLVADAIAADNLRPDAELARVIRKFVTYRQSPTNVNRLTLQEQARLDGWLLFPDDRRLALLCRMRLTRLGETGPTVQDAMELIQAGIDFNETAIRISPAEQRELHEALVQKLIPRIRTLVGINPSATTPTQNLEQLLQNTNNPELIFLRNTLTRYRTNIRQVRHDQIEKVKDEIRNLSPSGTINVEPNRFDQLLSEFDLTLSKEDQNKLNQLRTQLAGLERVAIREQIDLIIDPALQNRAKIALDSRLGPAFASFLSTTYRITLNGIENETNNRAEQLEQRLRRLEARFASGNVTDFNQEELGRLLREIESHQRQTGLQIDNLNLGRNQIWDIRRFKLQGNEPFFQSLINNFRINGYGVFLSNNTRPTNTQLNQLFNQLKDYPNLGREKALRVFSIIRTLQQLPPSVLNRVCGGNNNTVDTNQIVQDVLRNNRTSAVSRFIIERANSHLWDSETSLAIENAIDTEIAFVSNPIATTGRTVLEQSNSHPLVQFASNQALGMISTVENQVLGVTGQSRNAITEALNNLTRNTTTQSIREYYSSISNEGVGVINLSPNDPELTPLVQQIVNKFGEERAKKIFALVTIISGLPKEILQSAFQRENINIPELLRNLLNGPEPGYMNIGNFILETSQSNNWNELTTNKINEAVDACVNRIRRNLPTAGLDEILDGQRAAPQRGTQERDAEIRRLIQTFDGGRTQELTAQLNTRRINSQSMLQRVQDLRGLSFATLLRNCGVRDIPEEGIVVQNLANEAIRTYGLANIRRVYANLELYNLLPPDVRRRINPGYNPASTMLLGGNNPLATALNVVTTQQTVPPNISPAAITSLIASQTLESSEYGFLLRNNTTQTLQRIVDEEKRKLTELQREADNLQTLQRTHLRDLATLIRRGVTGQIESLNGRRLSPEESQLLNNFITTAQQNENWLLTPVAAVLCRTFFHALRTSDQEGREDVLFREFETLLNRREQVQRRLNECSTNLHYLQILQNTNEVISFQFEGRTENAEGKLMELLRLHGPALRYLSPMLWQMLQGENGLLQRLVNEGKLPTLILGLYNPNYQTSFDNAIRYCTPTPTHDPASQNGIRYSPSIGLTNSLQIFQNNPALIRASQAANEIIEISGSISQIVNARQGGIGTNPANTNEDTPAGRIYNENTVGRVRLQAERMVGLVESLRQQGIVGELEAQCRQLKNLKNRLAANSDESKHLSRIINQYESVIELVNNPNIRRFRDHVNDDSVFNASTFKDWLKNNGLKILGSILLSALAITATMLTMGAASPLAVFLVTGVTGGIGATVGGQLGAEASYQLRGGTSDRALWNRIGEERYNPDLQTGIYGSTSVVTQGQILSQLGQELGMNVGMTYAAGAWGRTLSGIMREVGGNAAATSLGRLATSQAGRQALANAEASVGRLSGFQTLRTQFQTLAREYCRHTASMGAMTTRTELLTTMLEDHIGRNAHYLSLFADITLLTLLGGRHAGRSRANLNQLSGGIRFNPTNRQRLFSFNPNHPDFAVMRRHLEARGCTFLPGRNGNLIVCSPGQRPLILHAESVPTTTNTPINEQGRLSRREFYLRQQELLARRAAEVTPGQRKDLKTLLREIPGERLTEAEILRQANELMNQYFADIPQAQRPRITLADIPEFGVVIQNTITLSRSIFQHLTRNNQSELSTAFRSVFESTVIHESFHVREQLLLSQLPLGEALALVHNEAFNLALQGQVPRIENLNFQWSTTGNLNFPPSTHRNLQALIERTVGKNLPLAQIKQEVKNFMQNNTEILSESGLPSTPASKLSIEKSLRNYLVRQDSIYEQVECFSVMYRIRSRRAGNLPSNASTPSTTLLAQARTALRNYIQLRNRPTTNMGYLSQPSEVAARQEHPQLLRRAIMDDLTTLRNVSNPSRELRQLVAQMEGDIRCLDTIIKINDITSEVQPLIRQLELRPGPTNNNFIRDNLQSLQQLRALELELRELPSLNRLIYENGVRRVTLSTIQEFYTRNNINPQTQIDPLPPRIPLLVSP